MGEKEVLIISGHLLFAQAIRQMLEVQGIDVGPIVENVEEAFAVIAREHPTTVILDANPETEQDVLVGRLLAAGGEECRILVVSLDNTDVNVYIRQRVTRATDSELVALVRHALPKEPSQP